MEFKLGSLDIRRWNHKAGAPSRDGPARDAHGQAIGGALCGAFLCLGRDDKRRSPSGSGSQDRPDRFWGIDAAPDVPRSEAGTKRRGRRHPSRTLHGEAAL